ncbi:hypothetical protein EPR50_G00033360 [Perca flavescens]|uniref:Ribonuclease A-domain domain-containing protein n=1 Tax=Perca flavescens TaxID=8167 RepID=A0A484DDG3_PERFV|nr:ribonuclease-like [Perca flavescens]TDH13518.1 hypothetical protein EPR50_G00033360 [Perca flavescens]
MKISVIAGVLLLSAAVISLDFVREEKTLAAKFINQHINEEMNNNDCTKVMNDRGITDYNGNCKLMNTFIGAPIGTVRDICGTGGQKYFNKKKPGVRDLRKSRAPFNIVVCRLKDATAAPCEYEGAAYNRHIVVACDVKGDPVHFDRFLSY